MKKNLMQLGRSMVEMLGVLAIIGVLSIVGIQGYKRAMIRHHVNEMWNAAKQFEVLVREYLLTHPGAGGDQSILMINAASCPNGSICIDREDLLPGFANNSYNNFRLAIRLQPTAGKTPYIYMYSIRQNGLCSAMFPDGTYEKNGSDVPNRVTKTIDGIKWICEVYTSGNTTQYTP